MTTLYGIPNCASVKKARLWLDARGIDYQFHDFKKQGVSPAQLTRWIEAAGLARVLNRKGTTWRKLSAAEQATAESVEGAITLMVSHSSLIKRPVLEHQQQTLLGFDEAHYLEIFGQ